MSKRLRGQVPKSAYSRVFVRLEDPASGEPVELHGYLDELVVDHHAPGLGPRGIGGVRYFVTSDYTEVTVRFRLKVANPPAEPPTEKEGGDLRRVDQRRLPGE